jgi:hypothetical protein
MSLIKSKKSLLCGKCNCDKLIRQPIEAYRIQTPVILSQIKMRKCVTRNIALSLGPENDHPSFLLKGTDNFKIINLRILTEIPAKAHSYEKKVDLLITIRYNLNYSDGLNDLVQSDDAYFELSIDNIICPDCKTKLFQKDYTDNLSSKSFKEKAYFTADALAETFGEVICPYTGALIIDIGTFFIIKSEYIMELSVPSFSDYLPYRDQGNVSFSENGDKGIFL